MDYDKNNKSSKTHRLSTTPPSSSLSLEMSVSRRGRDVDNNKNGKEIKATTKSNRKATKTNKRPTTTATTTTSTETKRPSKSIVMEQISSSPRSLAKDDTTTNKTTPTAMTMTTNTTRQRQRRRRRMIGMVSCTAVLLLIIIVVVSIVVVNQNKNVDTGNSNASINSNNDISFNTGSNNNGDSPVRSPSVSAAATTTTTTTTTSTSTRQSPPTAAPIEYDDDDVLAEIFDSLFGDTATPTTAAPANPSPTAPSSSSSFPPSPTTTLAPTTLSPTTLPPSPTLQPTQQQTTNTASPTLNPASFVTVRSGYELLETVPHNPNAFTQGLEVLSVLPQPQPQSTTSSSTTTPTTTTTTPTTTTTTTTTTSTRYMLESTGLYGQSDLRVVEIATGTIVAIVPVDSTYFAEGCTFDIINEQIQQIVGSTTTTTTTTTIQIVQLTWRQGVGFVYELDLLVDSDTTNTVRFDPNVSGLSLLRPVGQFTIDTTNGEGWGICYHPVRKQYIVSDGSSNLHNWELRGRQPQQQGTTTANLYDYTFERVDTIGVTRRFSPNDRWEPVTNLNELEWDPYPNLLFGPDNDNNDNDTILANIWQTNNIVRIRLSDGKVTHQYDMTTLDRPAGGADVLNGIAAVKDSTTTLTTSTTTTTSIVDVKDQYWVTGKWWPQMYRVRFLS